MSKNPAKPVYLDNGAEVLNNYELLNFLRDNEKIKKSDLLVALCLATRRNSITARCYPGKTTISRDTGLSESGVKLSIKNLQKTGILIVVNNGYHRNRNNKVVHDGRTLNSYYFCYDLKYQSTLIDKDEHPMMKLESERDLFDIAFLTLERG
jgi:hypothetical protein